FFPAHYFYTAERIISKPCTFDDYSGFNTYLSDKFSVFLYHSPTLKNIEDEFMYVVALDEKRQSDRCYIGTTVTNEGSKQLRGKSIGRNSFLFSFLGPRGQRHSRYIKDIRWAAHQRRGTVSLP